MTTEQTDTAADTAVPIVDVPDDGIRIHRPAIGHTFTFPVADLHADELAANLRGALADAYHAGQTETPPS